MAAHQRGAGHAVSAHPAALCTGTNADTCTPLDTGKHATAGLFSSSSSRYGLNNLNGLRGGSGVEGTVSVNEAWSVGGGEGRRTERSIGSEATGSGMDMTGDIAAGSGVGTCTGVGITAGGGDGSLALSGDPAAYGGGEGAG